MTRTNFSRFASIVLAAVIILLPTGSISAQTKTQAQKYAETIDKEEPFNMAVWGILAVKANGDTLANYNSRRKMLPASNTKLISTGLILDKLGSDFRYETKIGYYGSIKDGTLNGDIYIIGEGDPTIASKDSCATPINELFSQWKSFLIKEGITSINGKIIGDGRYFDGGLENGTWGYGDLGTYYGTGGNGLCFYENQVDFKAKPGNNVGDPVIITQVYPETPWIDYNHTCKTGEAGYGDGLELYNTDLAAVASMRGILGIESGTRTEECSNKFGAYTCAYYFSEFLKSNGILVSGGPADIDDSCNIRPDLTTMEIDRQAAELRDIKVIGSTFSAPLVEIVKECNHRSDNFYAETFLRTLAKKIKGSASYESCHEVEDALLADLGVMDSGKGRQIEDGSGLSRHDYISPDYFVRFLTSMTASPVFSDYVKTLPSPGKGTLKSRMTGSDSKTKARVFMKTGSMNGVRCYSGYILPANGKMEDLIIFSLLTNNIIEKNVYPTMDILVGHLAKENQ